MEKKLEALFDAVIVQPLPPEETSYGGIIIPDLGKEKNETGTVVNVGPGKFTVTGHFVETALKPGDVVILPTMGFTKFEWEGEEYYIGPETQVLAKIS